MEHLETFVKKIHDKLSEIKVPEDVWIGTNSIEDRLEWVKRRLEAQERTIKKLRQEIDISTDEQVLNDSDDDCGIFERFKDDGFVYLILGHLTIKMTPEQEEKLRFYFENT